MVRASLKSRQVTLYLPTEADVARWKSLSKAKGCSLSKFVYEMTERGMEEKRAAPKVRSIVPEMNTLRGEVSELRREVDQLKQQNSRLKEVQIVPEQTAKQYEKWIMDMFMNLDANLKVSDVKGRLLLASEQLNSRIITKVLRDLIDKGEIAESEKGLKWVKK